MTAGIISLFGKALFAILYPLTLAVLMMWAERRGAAFIQDRRGPNRAAIMGIRAIGLFHPIADFIKLIFKEDLVPARVEKGYYFLAPIAVMIPPLLVTAVFPFSDRVTFDGGEFIFQVARINPGVIYILAIASLGIYGILLAGWSSNSKYPFLGALRGSAQMLSYEVSMGLALCGMIMVAASPRLEDIIAFQGGEILGIIPRWGVLLTPIGFLVFLTALFAETNRVPFDLPEGESEIVAGFHLEYSGLRFAMFFVAEYSSMAIGAMLVTSLFFGGWQIPFFSTEEILSLAPSLLRYGGCGAGSLMAILSLFLARRFRRGRYGDLRDYEPLFWSACSLIFALLLFSSAIFIPRTPLVSAAFTGMVQFLSFTVKTLFFAWLFLWVRWTLPRFRYDQLMNFGWKVLLPLALFNLLLVALGIVL